MRSTPPLTSCQEVTARADAGCPQRLLSTVPAAIAAAPPSAAPITDHVESSRPLKHQQRDTCHARYPGEDPSERECLAD